METLYFTLGIASVVVTAVAVGAVWAMFKVAKLNAKLNDVDQQFASTHRDITMVEKTIMNNIEHNQRDLDAKFNDLYRDLDERFSGTHREIDERSQETQKQFDDVYRTIDSRIDKLAARSNAYDLMKEKKQLLKG
jgi:H2-forming N5,N10-methylenetetrahydromethanopterin dehydrogenase-like enzyme